MTTVQPSKAKDSVDDSSAPKSAAASEAPPHLGELSPRPDNAPTKKHRGWLWLILLLVAAGGGVFVVQHFNLLGPKQAAPAKSATRSVPVVTAAVQRGDVNLYLSGLLGTVTAFQSVTVRTRVDGQIMKVYFTEGQMIKAGEPLVEIDARPYQVQLAQAQGQLARDQASLTQGQQDLKRDQELVKTKSVTPQLLDAQVSTVGQYVGAVKTDQAMIANAQLQITYCHITAPFSGRIGLRLVDMGNFVQAAGQTPLAVITQLQPIAVIFPVPQDDIFRVQKKFNSGEDVVVEALNRDLTAKLATGKLLAIDNQVDITTGTVKLKAVFENEDNLLFPNEFVSMQLLIDTQRNVVTVPIAAIQHGPTSTFAFVVKSDQTVEMRQVTVGASENDQMVVEKGLSPGEVVVTKGTDKLQNGSKVELPKPKSGGKAQPKSAENSGKSTAQATQ
jgi:multidrug efflux system membrane fusion protein